MGYVGLCRTNIKPPKYHCRQFSHNSTHEMAKDQVSERLKKCCLNLGVVDKFKDLRFLGFFYL